ncbi:MAG: hypothetical protein Q7T96_04720 [Methylobacter sp.]|uniref:hypothetical protein n=1 Tax=Methylobacter sp. TaxID=2051955 RepID=UPI00271EEFDB|nr:hypothetical protein [Methylobacter sp.]MDO9268398.1 hypothetical protein [Methylobacter sp.]MDP1663676.1 hypothetical protein [Methylobacter sp.]
MSKEAQIEEVQIKDKFWLYVSGTIITLLIVIAMVKQSENEKFAPIKQQLEEETALMNIRVLN